MPVIKWDDEDEYFSHLSLTFCPSFTHVDWDTNMSTVPDLDSPFLFQGTIRFRDRWTWSQHNGKLSSPITNPTWAEALQAISDYFDMVNDGHHIFLESFEMDEPGIVDLFYGS